MTRSIATVTRSLVTTASFLFFEPHTRLGFTVRSFLYKKIVYDLICREKRDNSLIHLNKKKKEKQYA